MTKAKPDVNQDVNHVKCFIFVIFPPPVEALHVGEDTLPVRLLVLDHVLHVQQRVDVGQLPSHIYTHLVVYNFLASGVSCPRYPKIFARN